MLLQIFENPCLTIQVEIKLFQIKHGKFHDKLYHGCRAGLGFEVQNSSVQYFQYKIKLHIMLFLVLSEFLNIAFN
jgi:hypothetical protein